MTDTEELITYTLIYCKVLFSGGSPRAKMFGSELQCQNLNKYVETEVPCIIKRYSQIKKDT
jgi:hypothetical protein